MLNMDFDHYTGESFYRDKTAAVVEELKEKNLLKESEGAMIVDLDEYDMAPCLVMKKDGSSIYATRDLAAIFYRKKVLDSFHQDDIKEVKKTINNFFKYSIQSFQLKDH